MLEARASPPWVSSLDPCLLPHNRRQLAAHRDGQLPDNPAMNFCPKEQLSHPHQAP